MRTGSWVIVLGAAVSAAQAQDNLLSKEVREAYQTVKDNLLRSAEKMPAENYSFKPAPRVRTFGEILGHVAQEQYLFFCGPVKGEEKAADIQKTKAVGEQHTKLHVLWENIVHDTLHYGNLVTYLRIKGLVPPSTEGQ